MKNLKSQGGFALLPFSLVMAAVMASIFMYASSRSQKLSERVGRGQGTAYGNELSAKFAQRLRWAYDAARADAANAALGLCSSYGGVNQTVGSFRLCLINNQVCLKHPQLPSQNVCISRTGADPSIVASYKLPAPKNQIPLKPSSPSERWVDSLALISSAMIPSASAQNLYSPAEPSAGITSNSLTVSNTACIGGECRAICGVSPAGNADCLTFKFCPLVGTCSTNQIVWQTIAFIR